MKFSVGATINGFTILSRVWDESQRRSVWAVVCRSCDNKKILEKSKISRSKNCGCKKGRATKKALKQPPGSKGMVKLYKTYQYGAKSRGLEFNLSLEFFAQITKKNCAYCGVSPKQKSPKTSASQREDTKQHQVYIYNGIDRVDNSKGYTEDNCAPCCKFCNYTKKTHTKEEFMDWILRVVEFNAGTTKGTEL